MDNFSAEFFHAALYASQARATAHELFPGRGYFSLSDEEQHIVHEQTKRMLTMARWHVGSMAFAQTFALAPPATLAPMNWTPVAPPAARPVEPAPPAAEIPRPGQYL
jgi:hypothetical protein